MRMVRSDATPIRKIAAAASRLLASLEAFGPKPVVGRLLTATVLTGVGATLVGMAGFVGWPGSVVGMIVTGTLVAVAVADGAIVAVGAVVAVGSEVAVSVGTLVAVPVAVGAEVAVGSAVDVSVAVG